jgi:hypothetical protein
MAKLQIKEFWMIPVRKLKSHSRLLELMIDCTNPGTYSTLPIAADTRAKWHVSAGKMTWVCCQGLHKKYKPSR